MPTHITRLTPARTMRLIVLALLLGVALLLALPAQPVAASCGGTTTVGTETELNTAVTAFNAVATSPCVFTIELSGDISLTASTTTINNATSGVSLVIEGDGFAVDGQDTAGVRPFQIAANTTVTMSRLTVTGGNVVGVNVNGGGILNDGNLTLINVTVADNSVEDQGAGIFASGGNLTINSSTISGNSSVVAGNSVGGGIYVQGGTATIRNSTISGNSATDSGGGLSNLVGTVSVESSTIAYNSAPDGSGYVKFLNNGGTTFTNTILAANSGGPDCDLSSLAAPPTDGGHNLVGTQSGCAFTNGVNGNIVGSDPLLGPLAHNGGDTKTHALLVGSPAINAGDTTLTTDQRGITRPQGAADDIGAFEVISCTAFPLAAANEAYLNAAIGCYNQQTTPGTYTINITQDIDLTASTTVINNATSGVSLVIEGDGYAVDGQDTAGVRPFQIAANTTVTMNRLTVTNGNASTGGGGIRNSGRLTLRDSSVTSSTGVVAGGGIYVDVNGTVTINNSTISGNSVVGGAGANGGGMYLDINVTANIGNSTISGNTANIGGGITNNQGRLTLDSVTITANTAGLRGAGLTAEYLSAQTVIRNTILAGNLGSADCHQQSATVTDGGHNLVQTQDSGSNSCGFVDGVNGTILGQAPALGPLSDNGGETDTHALLGGSPALDAGDTALTTDQRGVTRPQLGSDDIGAYESLCGTATSWTAATEFELDTAIGCFNKQTVAGSYTITVTANISLTQSIARIENPTVGPSLVIEGGNHIIDGGNAPGNPGAGGFFINSPTAVTMNDLTVTRSRQLLTGGAIRNVNGGALTLNNVALTQNQAGFGGGALSSTGPVTITNSVISDNDNPAGKGGGGILIESPGSLTLIDSVVSDNTTAVFGGGISAASGAHLTITRSTIAGNSADVEGGGIFNEGSLTIDQSTVSGNTTSGTGGGVANGGPSTVFIRNSTISGNSATGSGGGLIVGNRNTLDGVTVANNTSGSFGAGVFPKGSGVITMTNSILGDNTSTGYAAGSGVVDCGSIGGGHTWVENHNLVEDGANCGFANGVNNTITGVDPVLGPLADNGGETKTHALLPGSPAIDAGATALTTDQRGVTRPQGAADDIGAFESQTFNLTIVKAAVGGDDTFEFGTTVNSDIDFADFSLTTVGGTAQTTLTDLPAGFLEIAEIAPTGWEMTDVECVGVTGDNWATLFPRASLDASPGDDITCTFTNEKVGSITIIKDADPADNTPFQFELLGGDPITSTLFTLQDPLQPTKVLTDVVPGIWGLGEYNLADGWVLTEVDCQSTLGTSAFIIGGDGVNIELAPGDDVVCTFVNKLRRGSLTVVKNAVGGDGAFPFTSPSLGAFTVTTASGAGRQVFPNLLPGAYSLSETVPAGWRLDSAVCSDGSPVNAVQIDPGEDVTCTFTDTRLDTIVVVKRAVGGDGSFAFTSPQLGAFNLKTLKGEQQTSFANLAPGAYSISENVPAGWTASAADPVCSNGDPASNITMTAGETVVCVFVNLKQDTIVVEKRTVGGDGTFAFSSPQLGAFDLSTTGGSASRSFTNLQPGPYSLAESVPAGWVQSGATCSDGSNPSSINLAPGATVSCVFTNTRLSSITVVKNATGGDGSFAFSSPQLGAFSLATTAGAARQTFANLAAGAYGLSEVAQSGWDLTGAACSDGSNPATISLAAGENVTCSFANQKRGSLTVVKNTVGGDATFDFTNPALGAFQLTTANGTAQRSFSDLAPGSYSVAESVPAGWQLQSATCSDGSNPANINIGAGENVTCTFTNRKLDTIVIVKQAVGGDATFAFSSTALGAFDLATVNGEAQRSFSNLAPGTYNVTESGLAGWTPKVADPVCSNGDPASAIRLDAGETVVCVFVNLKQDTIVVEKRTVGGDGAFGFTSNLPGGAAFNLTTANGVARQSFTGLRAGTYAIAESAPVGWVQTGATCDNGDAPASVSLAPGETVVCTFTNAKLGKIVIQKQAVGGDGTFAFSGDLGGFELKTANGLAKKDFFDLPAGMYAVGESVPAGWDLTNARCTDGSNPNAINLAAGEEVTCVFANTRRGSLAVVKNTTGGDGSFAFVSRALGAFSLATSGGTAQQVFANLVPGSYDLVESAQAGWSLTGATCSDGSSPVSVQLEPGENVTCTFANTGFGSLTIVKIAENGNATFPFVSQALGDFSLTTVGSVFRGATQRAFPNLPAGSYDIQAPQPAGWVFVSASCSDNSDPANIVLEVAENVTCTYVSKPAPTALDEVDEPGLFNKMFLPLIER